MSGPDAPGGQSGTRRTQTERSESTRARALAAVVDCIVKDGLPRTNFARIAERSGVSIGSIQHQFGDKAGVLLAVVKSGFEDLVREVAKLQTAPGPLRDRLRAVVKTMWRHRSIPEAQAAFEILIQMRSDRHFGERFVPLLARIDAATDRMWMGLFREIPVTRGQHVRARRLLFATLNGLATEKILLSTTPEPEQELEALAEALHHILTPTGTGPAVEYSALPDEKGEKQ